MSEQIYWCGAPIQHEDGEVVVTWRDNCSDFSACLALRLSAFREATPGVKSETERGAGNPPTQLPLKSSGP